MNAEEIFLAVLELSAQPDREAYLARACGNDQALRAEVEGLLKAHFQAGDFLAAPVAVPLDLKNGLNPGDIAKAEIELGTLIGPYKLLSVLGQGGMGLVYLAEQTLPVRRQVALKLIRTGLDSQSVLRRFEAERQALAMMDHPHIARVLDAGSTNDGRPYFVMELVTGLPITRYCDEGKLGVRERLDLFSDVCRAVQHAHQKGIIHRDIKPANVLVAVSDGKPLVKVIDFGIAKAVGSGITPETSFTQMGQLIGTLEYMSPEQARLDTFDVDTRSDIYSLGVLLYELLTGTTPFNQQELKSAAFDEILRMIREEDPPCPSARLKATQTTNRVSSDRHQDTFRIRRMIQGDLDYVVMKALEKDRDRRYPSASALAQDIFHFLHDDPVTAGPPSRIYRLRKFVRRNKVVVFSGLVTFIALLGGATALAIGLLNSQAALARESAALAEKSRALAAEQAARVEATAANARTLKALRSLTDAAMSRILGREARLTSSDKAFLRTIQGYFQAFAQTMGESRLARQTRAEGWQRVAELQLGLELTPDLFAMFQNAIDTYAALAKEFPDHPEYRIEHAKCLAHQASIARSQGDLSRAERLRQEGLKILEDVVETHPQETSYRSDMAMGFAQLAGVFKEQGRIEEADQAFIEAENILKRLIQDYPHVEDFPSRLANVQGSRGTFLKDLQRYDEAEPLLRSVILHRQKFSEDPIENPAQAVQLLSTWSALAEMLTNMGRFVDAKSEFDACIAMGQRLVAEYPVVPNYKRTLGNAIRMAGVARLLNGEAEPSKEFFRKGLDVLEGLVRDFPTAAAYQVDLAEMLNCLGLAHVNMKQLEEAEPIYQRAQKIKQKLYDEYPGILAYQTSLSMQLNNLGNLYKNLKQYTKAEEAMRAALELKSRQAEEHPDSPLYRVELGGSYCNLGNLLSDTGRMEDAVASYTKAIATLQGVLDTHPAMSTAQRFQANAYAGRSAANMAIHNFAGGLEDIDKAIAIDNVSDAKTRRLRRIQSLVQVNPVEAIADIEKFLAEGPLETGERIEAIGLMATAIKRDMDMTQRETASARVVALLSELHVEEGLTTAATIEFLNTGTELESVRNRADFQALLKIVSEANEPANGSSTD